MNTRSAALAMFAVLCTSSAAFARPRSRQPSAPTCAVTARQIVGVALDGLETAASEHERDRARVTKRLEEACAHDRWSAAERTCISAADGVGAMTACKRTWPTVDSRAPLARAPDLRCEIVGPHVAGLMIDQLASLAPDNIAAAVHVDAGDLPAQVQAACIDEQWSVPQLRCYGAATRFANIVACNQRSSRE